MPALCARTWHETPWPHFAAIPGPLPVPSGVRCTFSFEDSWTATDVAAPGGPFPPSLPVSVVTGLSNQNVHSSRTEKPAGRRVALPSSAMLLCDLPL